MNTPVKHLVLGTFIALAFVGTANAQRGEHRSEGGSRGFDRGGGSSRNYGGSNQSSTNRQSNYSFDRQSSRREILGNQTASVAPNRQSRVFENRSVVGRTSSVQRVGPSRVNSVYNTQRVSRPGTVYNNTRVVNNYRYGSGYSYAPRRWSFYGAPRYSTLPHGALTIRYGGYPYYYHSGLFFSYYNGFYEPVFAPIGIHVGILPVGYYPFYIGPTRYYYYDGVYYRNYNDNEYEVIDAPLGAEVSVLPKGATAATINGEKFYEFNGTYYKEGTNSKNEVVYTVVGKYGHINNTDETTSATDLQQPALHVGDVIPVLPDGCKEVTINGEQLYVSPDNTYFKAQNVDGTTSYKIVGTGTTSQQ